MLHAWAPNTMQSSASPRRLHADVEFTGTSGRGAGCSTPVKPLEEVDLASDPALPHSAQAAGTT